MRERRFIGIEIPPETGWVNKVSGGTFQETTPAEKVFWSLRKTRLTEMYPIKVSL
jgi:hypothetical protein